ncbi:WXG100 family type VII secretion target [Crossiella sp. CA198]|uniref:WXG100 family type VII secretion target n=1 Tax=Crossiella sp. CA198 TaxID=3455607 RepID=UPI003F8CFFF8
MGDKVGVNFAQLEALIKNLDRSAEEMTRATSALRGASAQELGSRAIDKAGKAFQDRWDHGICKIAEATEKMTKALAETKKDYEHTERAVHQLFLSGGGGQGAQAPPPARESAITRGLG